MLADDAAHRAAITVARHVVVPTMSRLYIDVQTTGKPIWGKGIWMSGWFRGALSGDQLLLDPKPEMHLDVPIASLRSENPFYDREMRAVMASRRHPSLLASLRDIWALSTPNHFGVIGDITVRGTTLPVEGTLKVSIFDKRLIVSGEQMMDIRKFGVEPPKIPLVTIKPEFLVRIALVFEPEPAA
jgi:hypothetical protein